jgi:hypothetical protein
MKPAPFRPRVVELEARAVPSVAPLSPPAVAAAHRAPLAGTLTGTYTSSAPGGADLGRSYVLTASGSLRGIRKLRLTGTLKTPGNVATGPAGGELDLFTFRGEQMIQVTSGPVPGLSPLPQFFRYTLSGGTGPYKREIGQFGSLTLQLTPAPGGSSGTFSLTFR